MKDYSYEIASFGEVLIDFTYLGDSPSGQKLFAQNPGGAPANVLVCASKLGAKTAFLGKAGADMHGAFLRKTLADENVNTDGFLLDDAYFTTLAFVDLNENGERTFSFARKPGADTQMTAQEMNLDVITNSKIFHVGSLSLTHEPSRSATFYAIEQARAAGRIVSYDPNYRASLWESEHAATVQMQRIVPDIMKISDEETALLTPHKGHEEAAKALFARGVKVVVVTLGGDGCYVYTKEGGKQVAGFKSNVVDTTGAGDAFWGAFLHQIACASTALDSLSLAQVAEYARFANAVASLCVEKNGAIPAMPSLQDVEMRLAK